MQTGDPNSTHTHSTNLLTPLSKKPSNTPFLTPFPYHTSHLPPTKYSRNRTTAIPISTPPNTLKTRPWSREGEERRAHNLTNTQWHTMPFLPYNHLRLLYPSHPWLSLTGHPVQRYDAAHEAQSGWTTAKQTLKRMGGEGQQFLEQKWQKGRKSAIFLIVPWQRPEINFLKTFLNSFGFYSFFVFFFSTVGIS